MACKIAVLSFVAAVAARQPHLISDDLKELESIEAKTVETVKHNEKDHSYLKLNPESQRTEAKDEIAAADQNANMRAVQAQLDRIDAYGHPVDDSPESVAHRVYEADVLARSAADAEKWNQKRIGQEQKESAALPD